MPLKKMWRPRRSHRNKQIGTMLQARPAKLEKCFILELQCNIQHLIKGFLFSNLNENVNCAWSFVCFLHLAYRYVLIVTYFYDKLCKN